MSGGGRLGIAVGLALAALALLAQPALATFHEMMIREIYPGSAAQPDSEYVELQMWSSGQNFVGGHSIGLYGASGALLDTATFSGDVSGGANQSTLLAATPDAEAEFGPADVGLPVGVLNPAGGAVCWEALDCVAWGGFSGPAKSPVGQPAAPAGIPDGMALRRTIAPGCATLLEEADDHDNSAADFSPVFPAPRPNSTPPSEHTCGAGAGLGSGPGPQSQAGRRVPQTRLTRRPAKRTRDRTPTFRFASSIAGSTFVCRMDRGDFKPCRSPFTAPRLRYGHHLFAVKARSAAGVADRSPATYGFTVMNPRRA